MSESKMWFHRINRLNISGCCLTTGPLQPATGEMCRASAGLAISLKKPPEMDRNHGKTWTGLPWVTEETEETNNRTSMRSNKLIRSINHQNISTISTKNIFNYRICNKSSIKSSFLVVLKFILSPLSTLSRSRHQEERFQNLAHDMDPRHHRSAEA